MRNGAYMTTRTVFAASLWLWCAAALAADPAPTPANYLARLVAARIPADAAAVVVMPLDGGALSFRANDRKPMNPASTMKLVTTYSALHLLGPAYTFRTEVLVDGPGHRAGQLQARTRCFRSAILEGPDSWIGTYRRVRFTGTTGATFTAVPVAPMLAVVGAGA